MGKMEINSNIKLKNGLKITHIKIEHLETAAFSLKGLAGSMHENTRQTGIAHFLEHLVFNGTKKFKTQEEITGYIEDVGGFANAYTSTDHVDYVVKLLKKDLERGFIYLSELALQPLLRVKDINKEKNVITQEIHRFTDSVEMYAPRKIYSLMYPDQRLGKYVTGEVPDIANITQQAIKEFRGQRYTAQNFSLAVCSNHSTDEIIKLAEKHFSGMKKGKHTITPKTTYSKELNIQVENRNDNMQSALVISFSGYEYSNSKVFSKKVISYILGESSLSRLYQVLREKHGLGYVVSSYIKSGPNYGHFNIYMGLAQQNVPKALKLIKEELLKLVEKGISETELSRVKNLAVAGFAFEFEDSLEVASYYSHRDLFRNNIKTHYDELEMYKNITADNIKATAKELFLQDPKILVVANNLNQSAIIW